MVLLQLKRDLFIGVKNTDRSSLYQVYDTILRSCSFQIAGFYAKMLEHDYTSKDIFNKNFFHDWRKEMTDEERQTIKDLKKCGFKEMHKYFEEVCELAVYNSPISIFWLDDHKQKN